MTYLLLKVRYLAGELGSMGPDSRPAQVGLDWFASLDPEVQESCAFRQVSVGTSGTVCSKGFSVRVPHDTLEADVVTKDLRNGGIGKLGGCYEVTTIKLERPDYKS